MSNTVAFENKITQGVIWRQLLSFFFPILLGTFFQQLYNTVDAVVVGNFVGKEALAAVGGATGTLINLLVGFFVGLSAGATVIISQYYGAGNAEGTSRAVHTAMAMSIAGGIIMMAVGLIFAPLALEAMGTPAEVMQYALPYLRIYFLGIIGNLIYNIGSAILRAIGDSRTPLYILIACTLTNLVLDLLFVVVFHMGVAGVGIATILSQAVSAVLVVIKLIRADGIYRLFLKEIRFDFAILKKIIEIGLPNGLQSVMYNLSNIIIQASINSFGTDTIAAWTAYGKIDSIFWMIIGAMGISVTTFSGQNFGAQKYDRVRKSVRIGLALSLGIAAFLSTVLCLTGAYVYRLFTQDAAIIEEGVTILLSLAPFYFTYVTIEIISGALRGTGDSLIPMLITCIGICVVRIIWVFAVVPIWHTVPTVTLSYPVSWALTSVVFLLYYAQGGWLRRRIRKAGFSAESYA